MRMPGEDREALLADDMMWGLLKKWGYNQVNETIACALFRIDLFLN